jgi:hypothetical protein
MNHDFLPGPYKQAEKPASQHLAAFQSRAFPASVGLCNRIARGGVGLEFRHLAAKTG